MRTLRITLQGRVFGVGFRGFVRHTAEKYSIKGTVRNAYEKDVLEIHCQGEPEKLEKFALEVRKGPSLGKVLDMKMREEDLSAFEDFEVLF